ncbi:MAG: cobyrinate a,c-diamide synthase [Pseudomonadota bacterium]
MPGLIVAAPASGSGKTTITLGILRALKNRGVAVRGAKSGPDYIDPRFHEAACDRPCANLDAWAMPPRQIRQLAATDDLLIIEGAMGLFDGAPPQGKGAVADLARHLKLPVVLVVDASHMAQSIAPLINGFAAHDATVAVAGVILNKVGSRRHEMILRAALQDLDIPVLGAVFRDVKLKTPSRHLGLVQAAERDDLEDFLSYAAIQITRYVDLNRLRKIAAPTPKPTAEQPRKKSGAVIAVARDVAFSFIYPHLIARWEAAGNRIAYFSPLADETVPPAELIYLPGGYPELHAKTLSHATTFLNSLRSAAQTSDIYGECGGYMTLGESITDADGSTYEFAGLLPLQTSFADRKLNLGYRTLNAATGPVAGTHKAHEFHYATTVKADGPPLFTAKDAEEKNLPPMGLRQGRVCGSFAHLIERASS